MIKYMHIKRPDQTVIYLLHPDTIKDQRAFSRLAEDIGKKTSKKIVVMSVKEPEARQLISFYHLTGSFFILVVLESGQLHHFWSDGQLLNAANIAFLAEQVR